MPCTKINSKLIRVLNIIAKTVKLLEENREANLCDLEFGSGFFKITPKAGNKIKIEKLDFVNIKTICETEVLSVE